LTIVLFDSPRSHRLFYPLSLTRPLCHIRHGLFSAFEWYSTFTHLKVAALSFDYLQLPIAQDDGYICVDASIIPTHELLAKLVAMQAGQMLEDDNGLVAFSTVTPPII
jgi:hypothetical protein